MQVDKNPFTCLKNQLPLSPAEPAASPSKGAEKLTRISHGQQQGEQASSCQTQERPQLTQYLA